MNKRLFKLTGFSLFLQADQKIADALAFAAVHFVSDPKEEI